ncbi:hypothetical protein B7L70_01570 [Vulcanisaeta sp. EB80]|jgi:hypothetical protein|uniref:hypothetical protein n=1 Tax=Vulcanisaeta sp. EB80 TaxID=1650660 RepID=UPI0009BE71BB|nr:hypothetical protein [Vulcanisaeta sp. EB80]MCG2864326.1 hypothetical protein [Vulcanisaeta sp.]MCG2866552.1 hypothetical protein [Vulcanisaeta sp.]MCG2884964.1 hypothetical protein [Vulcanisaeta sp.]PLC68782.1 hypothetical protein B7L70_01570 [Vulcanisaeta sp. EB80]
MAAEAITILLALKRHGRMGRYSLSSITGIGEGVVRRVLNELREQGAIRVMKGGAELTSRGEEILSAMLSNAGIVIINEDEEFAKVFNCGCKRCYALVTRRSFDESDVVRLRDIAIKNGADAVLFLRYDCSQNKFLILRLGTYFEDMYKDLGERLRGLVMNIKCDDSVMIVCGSTNYQLIKSIMGVLGNVL